MFVVNVMPSGSTEHRERDDDCGTRSCSRSYVSYSSHVIGVGECCNADDGNMLTILHMMVVNVSLYSAWHLMLIYAISNNPTPRKQEADVCWEPAVEQNVA